MGALPLVTLFRRRGALVRTAGVIVARQKPPTAQGYAFFVLEDGPYRLQLVIPPELWQREYQVFRDAPALIAEGHPAGEGEYLSMRAERVWPLWRGLAVSGYHYG